MTTLTVISNLVKTKRFQLTITGLLILVLIVAFALTKTPKVQEWKGIFIGKSTQRDVENKLGKPLSTETQDNKTTYNYPTQNQYRQDQVVFQNQITNLVKEQVINNEKGKLPDYINKYGQPDSTLFGSHGTIAPGRFWGRQGLLVFAGQYDGTIIEIWYFKPTTIEAFLKGHPELSTNPQENFKP